ncbi:MarR family transcriptional regulator [Streptomyces sp. H27-H1]|uniref:MarR family winged helix-turn-helix transcriptional regulator n=1 Tax=Streptomyces sp. H27-H1 TaxID=2996461 RepID=UPI00226EE898|nr:MarR family transcriptional regulator [Streptomyces sp. H27-H1]MCY0929073.1 MarR family transcriptional regulator [Streptomyces sp. H27-H1]
MNASPLPADDATDDRWCMAVRLLNRMEQRLDEALRHRHALPLSEYRAMCALSRPESADGLRMGELAERIGMKDSSVTRLVARLELQGLAERVPGARSGTDSADGRAVSAQVTEAGRERYAAATPTYRAALGAELDAARTNPYLADLATWVRAADAGAQTT